MQITFTGHNLHTTDALKDFTTGKFDKLVRLHDGITSIHVTFNVENLDQIAEATIHVPGSEIHAKATSEDMYNAVDSLVDKLKRQLQKLKDKHKEH